MRINAVIGSMTLALTATVLAACGSSGGGSSSSGGYCDELKADKAYFESLSGSNADVSNLDQVFEKVHTLAADAPDNVSDDWKTLDDAITTIETALKTPASRPVTWLPSRRVRCRRASTCPSSRSWPRSCRPSTAAASATPRRTSPTTPRRPAEST